MRVWVARMGAELWPFDSFVYAQIYEQICQITATKPLLSSKSENLFLVNFQTKKPTMPMTATPAATDMPTIDPVDRLPPPSSSDLLVFVGKAVVDNVSEALVMVMVTASPAAFVVVIASPLVRGGAMPVVEEVAAVVGDSEVGPEVVGGAWEVVLGGVVEVVVSGGT